MVSLTALLKPEGIRADDLRRWPRFSVASVFTAA